MDHRPAREKFLDHRPLLKLGELRRIGCAAHRLAGVRRFWVNLRLRPQLQLRAHGQFVMDELRRTPKGVQPARTIREPAIGARLIAFYHDEKGASIEFNPWPGCAEK